MSDGLKKRSIQERVIIAKTLLETILNDLPSADPTHPTPSNTLGALDCIDRQEAIKAILGEPPEVNYPIYYAEKIRELPSVQSRKGKWIDSGYGVECSLCGEWYPHASIARNQLNFCPNCGADMREGDAE